MNKIWTGALLVLVIGAGTYFWVHKNPNQNSTIKIGAIFALSNSYLTPAAEAERKAVDMAVKEWNAKGGLNGQLIEVEYQDQQGDNPQGAVSAYYKLTSEGVGLIIGPDATPAASALAPLADKDHVVLIGATVGSEKFAPASDYTFDTWEADQVNSIALGKYLYDKGYRKIAILGSQQEWEKTQAESVKQGFEQAGGTTVDIEEPQVSNLDLRDESLKIKNAKPDAVVFTDYGEVMVASQRMRGAGIMQPFFSVVFDDTQLAKAQGALEGTVSISSFSPTPEYTQKFEAVYGEKPLIGADTAYDAANVLFTAIQHAHSIEPQKVKDELKKITTWEGASGHLTFDQYGGVHKEPVFYIVKDNSIQPYTP